ncbi:hypothetical protein [Teredinibacter turnerae]|uniref:hypothetical protein n=1 Tax=Teredinibacter turnerae TaxID=2426 RepID=UPI00048B67FB|nr:hypothetical protein [Teredinibacter turnerae]
MKGTAEAAIVSSAPSCHSQMGTTEPNLNEHHTDDDSDCCKGRNHCPMPSCHVMPLLSTAPATYLDDQLTECALVSGTKPIVTRSENPFRPPILA